MSTNEASERAQHAGELETVVAALPVLGLVRLVALGRMLRDESTMKLTPSERARHARAELETIVASLPADELVRLVALGRTVAEEIETGRVR